MQVLYRHGRLMMYRNQGTIRQDSQEDGIFVVVSGLVRVTYNAVEEAPQEYFLGTGAQRQCRLRRVSPAWLCIGWWCAYTRCMVTTDGCMASVPSYGLACNCFKGGATASSVLGIRLGQCSGLLHPSALPVFTPQPQGLPLALCEAARPGMGQCTARCPSPHTILATAH